MDPAAQIWCREQLLRQFPQWPLLEQFLPASRRDDLLLCQGLLSAMLQSAVHSASIEVAAQKLSWWADAMQQLLKCTAHTPTTALPAELQHPALQQLCGDSRLAFFRMLPLTAWLQDLQQAMEPPAVADVLALRRWCWRLARPLDWLDCWLHSPAALSQQLAQYADQDEQTQAAASVHARRLLLHLINTLPQRNWLYRNLPMTLRARHRLQLDAVRAALPEQPEPLQHARLGNSWQCPGPVLADLLAVDADMAVAVTAATQSMPPGLQLQTGLWQHGNDALAQRLQRRTSSAHAQPATGITVALAWSYWRTARRMAKCMNGS